MRKPQYRATLILCTLLIAAASSASFAQSDTANGSGCVYLDWDKPTIFISYDRRGTIKNEKGKDVRIVYLRMHNNTSCSISVETGDVSDNEVLYRKEESRQPSGEVMVRSIPNPPKNFELPIFYDIKESVGKNWKPANYWENNDVVFHFPIPPGHSAAFLVEERFFQKKSPISVRFNYKWEADKTNLYTVSHRAFYFHDLPKGYYINEADDRYPAVWFTPINDPNKPSWEILPQEAKAGEVILSKRNELGILSNFAATPFELYGKRYASVEGFWQMMLYPEGPDDERAKDKRVTWKYTREQVAQMTAFEAKSAGTLAEENMKTLGIDWVTFDGKRFQYRSATPGEHYRLILAAMRAKTNQNPEVKRILLATGDLTLKPDHHGEHEPPPEWKYYDIWMQIRSELQAAMDKPERQ